MIIMAKRNDNINYSEIIQQALSNIKGELNIRNI